MAIFHLYAWAEAWRSPLGLPANIVYNTR